MKAFVQLKDYLSKPTCLFKPQLGEILYLCLAILTIAISVVYVCDFVLLIETKYPNIKS